MIGYQFDGTYSEITAAGRIWWRHWLGEGVGEGEYVELIKEEAKNWKKERKKKDVPVGWLQSHQSL